MVHIEGQLEPQSASAKASQRNVVVLGNGSPMGLESRGRAFCGLAIPDLQRKVGSLPECKTNQKFPTMLSADFPLLKKRLVDGVDSELDLGISPGV